MNLCKRERERNEHITHEQCESIERTEFEKSVSKRKQSEHELKLKESLCLHYLQAKFKNGIYIYSQLLVSTIIVIKP